MSVPVGQMLAVLRHVVVQRLRGNHRYPLALMLEPLLRCNLAYGGCGKIQHPPEVLRSQLTPEQCLAAVDECGGPMVSIPGGEPLLHPGIEEIVAGIVARKRYLYLCTNALKLEEMLPRFTPSFYLAFSVHLDGPREEHDHAVCREGVYDRAVAAIRAARRAGFCVTTNSTLFAGADPARYRQFFDEVMALGVEGMMISPGYSYSKAPDQSHFLPREQSQALFRRILDRAPGRASGNPKCADCMVHCGYEPAAVEATFGSLGGFLATARLALFGPPRPREPVPEPVPAPTAGGLRLQPNGLPALPVIDRVA